MDTRQMAHEMRLEHWEKVLRERKASGPSIRRWCRDNGVGEKTYYYWQRKLRERVCDQLAFSQEESQTPAIFTQVRLPASPGPACGGKLIIRLNGAEVEIHATLAPISFAYATAFARYFAVYLLCPI